MEREKYRVLLVEDDRIDQMAFRRMVEEEELPYDYVIAGSVEQAMELLASEGFDVAVLDYNLGDGTAFDVLGHIGDIPAIFATGDGDEELAVKALKRGAADYMIKDHERRYLKVMPEVIKNAVKNRRARRQLQRYHDNLEVLVRERAEQLATEKELLSVTLSSMGDGVVAVDAGGRIMMLNAAGERLLGWSFADAEGLPVEEVLKIVDEQTQRLIECPIDKVLASGEMETIGNHSVVMAADGRTSPVSITAAPIRKPDGTVIGTVAVLRDVSSQRQIEQMKADFISTMSHELRTPLTSIKACTETILSVPGLDGDTRMRFLGVIDEESDRLAKLIESLLEISRLESGRAAIRKGPVDLGEILDRVIPALKPLADKKNVDLTAEISLEADSISGDPDKLQSVVTNLIDNAIKFTPGGGKVVVTANRKDREVVFSVTDTGPGIPREAITDVFDRFYRVYRPGEHIHGSGLGLAIVKEIVMMHDGRIELDSQVGRGSTFTVSLPLAADSARQVDQAVGVRR